jgi:ornithine cyclodeaminase/alanine dehydrogenase-like protein (mu-crystallin family)
MVIEAVEEALRQRATGPVWDPVKATFFTPDGQGYMRVLPGGLPSQGFATLKSYLDPKGKGAGGSVVLELFDMRHGRALAIMGAERIGQLRTAAASAVAVKYLANKDSSNIGLFGSGNQAASHIDAICKVRDVKKVKVYSPNSSKREEFCRRMEKEMGLEIIPCDNPDDPLKDAEIIVAATTAKQPVFRGELLEEGVQVNSIGGHLPNVQELDDYTVANSKLVVDSKDQALKNRGNILVPISKGIFSESHIHGELGDIVIGKVRGRESSEEKIVFDNTGLSIYDVAAAGQMYQLAKKRGLGYEFEMEDL